MSDSRYRLAKQEEMNLDGNANKAEVRIMRGKRSQRQLGCNTSLLVFLIILLALSCIALVALLAIEKMRSNDTTANLVYDNSTSSNTSGNAMQPPCTTTQCVLAASSK